MYKQFENWLIENQGLKASTAKDYARDSTKALERHFSIGLGEFIRSTHYKNKLHSVFLIDDIIESISLSVLADLNVIYKTRKPAIQLKTFRNIKSAVINYIQFFVEKEQELRRSHDEEGAVISGSSLDVSMDNGDDLSDIAGVIIEIERSDLKRIYTSRLRTQDRAYASGFIFPNRFFAKIYLGTDSFDNYFIKPQIAGAKYFINEQGAEEKLSDILSIRLSPSGSDGYQVIAVVKDGEKVIYARNADGVFVPLVVRNFGSISLDHFVPIQTILQQCADAGSIPFAVDVSNVLRAELERRSLKTMPSDNRRTDIFKTVSGILTPEVVGGLTEEFKLISQKVRLELMHKHHNSAKGNR